MLAMNNLTALPPALGALSALQHLDASDNRLAAAPPALGACLALRSLSLRANSLVAICGDLGALTNLTSLDLSMNQIGALPGTIGGLVSLQQVCARVQCAAAPPLGCNLQPLASRRCSIAGACSTNLISSQV